MPTTRVIIFWLLSVWISIRCNDTRRYVLSCAEIHIDASDGTLNRWIKWNRSVCNVLSELVGVRFTQIESETLISCLVHHVYVCRVCVVANIAITMISPSVIKINQITTSPYQHPQPQQTEASYIAIHSSTDNANLNASTPEIAFNYPDIHQCFHQSTPQSHGIWSIRRHRLWAMRSFDVCELCKINRNAVFRPNPVTWPIAKFQKFIELHNQMVEMNQCANMTT